MRTELRAVLLALLPAVAQAGSLELTVRGDHAPLADAVVVAVPLDAPAPAPVPGELAIDQIDKEFVSRVTIVPLGSRVKFPNHDQIRHQVYSFSPAKRFELPLYAGTPANPIEFDMPGVVALGCNIHDWMLGYVYVAPTPWFAKSGNDGRARIDGVPAGRYRLQIWHPRLVGATETTREVTVGDGPANEAIELELKPGFKPRRAPVPGIAGYR
ncbi:MAG: hypothetical protein HY749_17730 [Gammaproteobacteria bacterium]|nr:hypothetical protein [Gammaproteobacteria bacterium]MBI5615940.1 hypothetical protein [Gammaproteobacteria bacterium]